MLMKGPLQQIDHAPSTILEEGALEEYVRQKDVGDGNDYCYTFTG